LQLGTIPCAMILLFKEGKTMKQYTAFYTIENIVSVCFEAENDVEAERIAEEMASDGTVLENLGYEMRDFMFNLDELVED